MIQYLRTSAALIALLLLALTAGCDKTDPPAKGPDSKSSEVKDKTDDDEHSDEHGDEHGQEHEDYLIDVGDHLFLGRMDCDRDAGKISVTILDHDEKLPYPHEATDAVLNLVIGGSSRQFKMTPDPLKDDPTGFSSRYTAAHEDLKGHGQLKGRLNVTIDGETHICDLAKAH